MILGHENYTGATPRWQRDRGTMGPVAPVGPSLSAVGMQRSGLSTAYSAPVFVGVPCSSGQTHALKAENMGHAADAQRGSP